MSFHRNDIPFASDSKAAAPAISKTDLEHERQNTDSSLDRTRRLLYVTCSRAEQSLALVAYTSDPQKVRTEALREGWFEPDEIVLEEALQALLPSLPRKWISRMAKVKIEAIVEYLKTDMRRALEAAVKEAAPEATFNSHALFRSFRRAVRRKCNVWETVPDDLLEK